MMFMGDALQHFPDWPAVGGVMYVNNNVECGEALALPVGSCPPLGVGVVRSLTRNDAGPTPTVLYCI